MARRPRRLHVCSDETGQDTKGEFFLVATIIFQGDRDQFAAWLEEGERSNVRGSVEERRLHFVDVVISSPRLAGSIFFSEYTKTTAYRDHTIASIRRALDMAAPDRDYEADIVVDGLPRSEVRLFGKELRAVGIPVHRVRGARDESDALTRLAHRVATFIRHARQGRRGRGERLQKLLRIGAIREA